jgi:hypothetical protein
MGFDDLARHMAGRDKRKLNTSATADELVAEARDADRRLSRQRNLILGPILIVCGLTLGALLYFLYTGEAKSLAKPDPRNDNTFFYSIGGTVLAVSMFIGGVKQTLAGLRASR